jgi:putative hydrolase of the HAD superfamily
VIEVVAVDADDTLWHNETLFELTQERFRALVAPWADVEAEHLDAHLLRTEQRNLAHFGYGIKGFTLSLIETAIELTEGRIPASAIQTLIDRAREMVSHPVELLPGVRETVERLATTHRLVLMTKGDLMDQESKVARSGLADLFERVEIVSEKDEPTYRRIITACGVEPGRFLMAGNSLRSDVLPVVAVGGNAVHIPYAITWAHEAVEVVERDGWWTIDDISALPDLIATLDHRD